MALLPDFDATSILDVVEENFRTVGLKTYAIRMIYIGEHCLSKDDLITTFKKSVNDVNSGYCDINVNGLLLVYDSYFIHIIEGSEDTIHRLLRFIFVQESNRIKEMKDKPHETVRDGTTTEISQNLTEKDSMVEWKMFKRLKILIIYHSIKKLSFHDWRAITARPPSLVGKLDVYGPLSEHMEQLHICLDKITKLCTLAKFDESLSFEGLSAVDRKINALPEVALLDYLLQSKHILDLHEIVNMHRRVDDYIFYFEKVWPVPTHFTPRLLYKLKIDDTFVEPLPVMPWELTKKEAGDDEEKEERQSDSSSSD